MPEQFKPAGTACTTRRPTATAPAGRAANMSFSASISVTPAKRRATARPQASHNPAPCSAKRQGKGGTKSAASRRSTWKSCASISRANCPRE